MGQGGQGWALPNTVKKYPLRSTHGGAHGRQRGWARAATEVGTGWARAGTYDHGATICRSGLPTGMRTDGKGDCKGQFEPHAGVSMGGRLIFHSGWKS